jgi:hypothetical protein
MDPTQAIALHDDNDNVDDGGSNVEEIPQILVSLTVKEKEKVFELHEGTHSIGRTDDNKIILSYASISKKHALLEVSKSSNTVYCFVTDCGSLNKTRLCRSDDEKGIVLTPNTRYEILPDSKLIFGDVTCQLIYHTAAKEMLPPVNLVTEEHNVHSDTRDKIENNMIFKKPVSLEATQAYEVTDEELLNDLSHESREVVPKRRASKWEADHATQPYEESETTTLGSLNNTAGNASLKSDSSTLWFKKDKPKEELASTQAYDEEATQGPDRSEIKVIVTAPTQAYDDSVDEGKHKDEAATQAYDEHSSDARPKDSNATQVYEEIDVPMKDISATLAYEEPSSPVKLVDNNATQAYEEPSSPPKQVDNNATLAYDEDNESAKDKNNNNATQAYDDDKPEGDNINANATQAYEEPPSPVKLSEGNNANEEELKPADDNATQAYEEANNSKLMSHTPKGNKVVKFAEATQVYEEPSSPKLEDINNATLPIAEPNSPVIDNNATLPVVEFDIPESPEKQHDEKMEIDNPESSNKQEDEESSSLFHDSHQRDKHAQSHTRVNHETRHSDSSDTQGPQSNTTQSKVTVASSSKITTSIVETTVDNEATLMIVDSTEIKNNESMEATLQLPSTPPVRASADSLSDEAVESMPSDLWFIKHKDKASEEAEPDVSCDHPTNAAPEQNERPHSPPHADIETTTNQGNEDKSGRQIEGRTASTDKQQDDTSHNNSTEPQPKSRHTTLRKSLSPTRVRAKIEPEEGLQEETISVEKNVPAERNPKNSTESQQSTETKSTRGRRKTKSESESQPELQIKNESVTLQTPTKRTTRRSSNTNVSNTVDEIKEERAPSQSDSQDHTPRKTSKRKLSQSVDDSPRAPKRVKTSPEVKTSQSKTTARRKSTSDMTETDTHTPRILFTGFPEDTLKKYAKTVETLGGHVVADLKHVTECTHLVTDSAQRTVKFLAALNCVKHVVTSKWIEKCQKQHVFVDESPFMLRDHTAERKFDFHLENSLQSAAERKVFATVSFVITSNVKPAREDLKTIVTTAGGQYLKTAPKKVDHAVVIIACAEDLDQARTLHAQGYRVYTPEFVLSSVIRQEIDYEQNLLADIGSAPELERKKSKKK